MRNSVHILTCYDNVRMVAACLESLAVNTIQLDEVIVVETAPTPTGFDPYQYFRQTTHVVVHHVQHEGFFGSIIHHAWNQGLELSTGDISIVCNDDLLFGLRAIDQLTWATEQFKLGCVYPVHTKGPQVPPDFFARAAALGQSEPRLQGPPEFRGFCFGLTKAAVAKVGLFDTQFRYFYGDDDYWYRLLDASIGPREVATALVHHYESFSTGRKVKVDPEYARVYQEAVNGDFARFQTKWKGVTGQELARMRGLG